MIHELQRAWQKTSLRLKRHRAVIQASDGKSCTFGDLEERSTRWLAEHVRGPLSGLRVVFSTPNGIGWFEIFISLVRAGAVVVPLDPAEPAGAQLRLAKALKAHCWWDGSKLVFLDGARRSRDPSACLIKLTSGTTGQPRPLVFTAKQILADARQVTATMGIRQRDLNYALIPLGHSYGLGNLAIPLIAQGVPLVCGETPLPHSIASDFKTWRPTVFPGVPAMWRALNSSGVMAEDLGSLRLAISAGAPLTPEVAHGFHERFGRRLHNFYGSSETGGIAFDRIGTAVFKGGVGRALNQVRITAEVKGTIRVCSAAVFTQGNRRRRGRLGCWVPADRASLGPRGELELMGRRGTLVKIAGRRVNLAEVETRLRRVAGIRDVSMMIGPGAEPVLCAVVATERALPDIRGELIADTAPWKIPKKWLFLPSLPLTARGKVDSKALFGQLFPSP